MSDTDIYGHGSCSIDQSLRYIHIVCRNVVGILNRISSLMRRKRFNMEDISLFFASDDYAHFCIMVNGDKEDVEQMISQIHKLHDVIQVKDVSDKKDDLYNDFYVMVHDEAEFANFPIQPLKVVREEDGFKGLFIISIKDIPTLKEFLDKEGYHYAHRLVHLL